ncbi:hypothetical protein H312_01693 [Anncaliia algerae PRA339]|uniref:Separase n=1 Tax=Anncaliia algerae PRA339 TaxID=1288291 RepID=A0A059F1N4_9MICR|nr:hypothetical protein H312_01693 [Anncaliia algerae PRA339]
MNLPNTKEELKEAIKKINNSLKSKVLIKEDIELLKKFFIKYKKPQFLLGLLSFYEKSKEKELLIFVKENLNIFKEDFSEKANQLFVVYSSILTEEVDIKRMKLEEKFYLKYKSIFTGWFKFSYFDTQLFNPVVNFKENNFDSFELLNNRMPLKTFTKEDSTENDLLECYYLISKEEYYLALHKLTLLLKRLKMFTKCVAIYLHAYNLISFVLFYTGHFIEAITYLEMGDKLIQSDYFVKVIKLIKERKGPMNVFLKELNINYTDYKKNKINYLECTINPHIITNKKLIFNLLIYYDPILRDLIYEDKSFLIERICKDTKIKDLFSIFSDLFANKNVLSIHKRNSFLELTLYPSKETQRIKINFSLKKILLKSKQLFKRKVKDKIKFNNEREELNKEIEEKVRLFNQSLAFENVKYLLVENFEFPFEHCTKLKNSKRIFNLSGKQLDYKYSSIFYVLDPQNKLPKTKEKLLPYLKKYSGVVNRSAEQSDIASQPISLLYFGHGNGNSYLKFRSKTASVCLFGCSSAKSFFFTGANPHGAVYKYKCNKFIGCLWDVSDKDIDSISIKYITDGVIDCSVAKYMYLGGSAVVTYEII